MTTSSSPSFNLFPLHSGRRLRRRTARGINTINTRRCVELFVTLGLRPRKANASAKHVKDCRWGVAAPWWIETSGQWGAYGAGWRVGKKPQNTPNTPKERLRRRTVCDFTAKYHGASQARAVHAMRTYMNRGLRSFHSLTPGCELSPFQGWGAAPRRGEEGTGRPTNDGDTPHMRPDEGRKYPGPGPLIHSSTGRTSVRIDAPEPEGHCFIHHCLAACRTDDTYSLPRLPSSP